MGNAHHHDIHQNKINALSKQNMSLEKQTSNWKMIAIIAIIGIGITIIYLDSTRNLEKDK
jgi:hypothetical protein